MNSANHVPNCTHRYRHLTLLYLGDARLAAQARDQHLVMNLDVSQATEAAIRMPDSRGEEISISSRDMPARAMVTRSHVTYSVQVSFYGEKSSHGKWCNSGDGRLPCNVKSQNFSAFYWISIDLGESAICAVAKCFIAIWLALTAV